jgi:uncharacterized protein (TIGR02145 family)
MDQTVKIGAQEWASNNLNATNFRNGDTIKKANNLKEWQQFFNAKEPAFCAYEFDDSKVGNFGYLYNWYAIIDPRNLAPEGFAIPTEKDWTTLIDACGKKKVAGFALKSASGWGESQDDKTENGDNSSGMNVLPSGYITDRFRNGEIEFMNRNFYTVFWTGTLKKGSTEAYIIGVDMTKTIDRDTQETTVNCGYSVRCIKK